MTLTRREYEIVKMVARGMANKQISRELTISERTIEKHLTNIMRKLGASNRAHIAAFAVRDYGCTP